MAKGFFITGTDTGIGKSWCSAGIMEKLKQQGHNVVGMKPVASGCELTPDGLRNEDALLLQQQGSVIVDYALVNPYSFAPAIAPHIAATQAGERIKLGKILERYTQLKKQSESVVVEGVGGWLVPLNDHETVADLGAALKLPVILVVGMRLGCINHALLSAESIRASGSSLAGWIANSVDPQMDELQATINAIAQRLDAPLLGVVPHMQKLEVKAIASSIDISLAR
ncbi:MAG: dethiobiotin synthase [Chromatiales bacterium]|nr:dethiobiotin synthase [Chromatiales bacterium]